MYTPMVDVLTPGVQGEAEIRFFEISPFQSQCSRLRAYVPAGRYASLHVRGHLVMSDTLMEQDTNADAVQRARGHVLIAGLGLGMIVLPMAAKRAVKTITVVERSQDVIELVLPPLLAVPGVREKLRRVDCADIHTWDRDHERFDFIYFDIWPDICRDALTEIATLHRQYRPAVRPRGTMRSWMHDELKAR